MDAPKPIDPKHSGLPEDRKSSDPGTYISPRLREKLTGGGDDDFFEPKSGSMTNWIVAGMLVVIAVLAGIVVLKGRGPSTKTSATAAEAPPSTPAAAPVDSSANASDSSTTPPLASTPPVTPPAAGATASGGASKPASTPAAPPKPAKPTPAATAETPAAPKPQAHFGIKVGSYLNEDRAKTELDRLKTATGLDARVLTVDEGGSPSYQLVLGLFASRKEADKKAADLITKGAVEEAVVVPVKDKP